MTTYAEWFRNVAGCEPHSWQRALASEALFDNRLIRIPTGFGKTLGVLLAWAFHRVERADDTWPRRLLWCLPMRVLVEQTHAEARRVMSRLGVLWDGAGSHEGKVGVHLLMGGSDPSEWHMWPEHCAVLVGTQDMLLSRALNRGYAAARARWPIDFGLLNHDCLWVMDEVQLMDAGLASGVQLQAFRQDGRPLLRPVGTWWMSATLQRDWLVTRDTASLVPDLPCASIPPTERTGPLWKGVRKPMQLTADATQAGARAKRVAEEHERAGAGASGPTLVVLNTVERAMELARALQGPRVLPGPTEVRLVHSRFRPAERAAWRAGLLNREACGAGTNRIIVATQVVEAGVDISAALLITDLAPWPSLVQRFGRCARWGGSASVLVLDTAPKDDNAALPYAKVELDAARDALARLSDVSPASLESFEEQLSGEERTRLYPYEVDQLLLRHEIDELFDTAPDLSGADIDVSRFIRSGDERDVQIFWAAVPPVDPPPSDLRPTREALCAVPFLKARAWLCGNGRKLQVARSAYVWSWLDGAWREADSRDIYPGQTVLVDAAFGGYDWDAASGCGLGWSAQHRGSVVVVGAVEPSAEERADAAQDDESLSATPYRTIATHGAEVAALAADIAEGGGPRIAAIVSLAGHWHDVGKAHAAFQGSMRANDRPDRADLAKAPRHAWSRATLYRTSEGSHRPGFRHELASALALFAVLRRRAPQHPALLGEWAELLAQLGDAPEVTRLVEATPILLEQAVLELTADEFDLLAYLVASHHGKVRVSLHASPSDQEATLTSGEICIRGVRGGDMLPSLLVGSPAEPLPPSPLDLAPASIGLSARTGRSWTDRVLGLIARHGAFQLGYLEALLRAADQRASRITTPDPLLTGGAR
jgi:CRISPR-associated endonuclease/helicase Cas3